jgi:Uma2 family endonuclease
VGPPDIVVEILSPSTQRRDKLDKRNTYAAYGVPEYWVVDPVSGSLELHELMNGRYELVDVFIGDEVVQSNRLPCASFTMADIMRHVEALPM